MESSASTTPHQKALPLPPAKHPQTPTPDGFYSVPERSTARPRRDDRVESKDEREAEIRALRIRNEDLKRKVVVLDKLQAAGERLMEEVQRSTDCLFNAVTEFRREQKSIDPDFFRQSDIQSENEP